tara:strand:+ start:424 stop:582 length:159 start_codon:yes stop_codon:yes gene_type:complete
MVEKPRREPPANPIMGFLSLYPSYITKMYVAHTDTPNDNKKKIKAHTPLLFI